MSSVRSLASFAGAVALSAAAVFAAQGTAAAAVPVVASAPAEVTVREQATVQNTVQDVARREAAAPLGTSWCRIGSVVYECESMPE